MYVKVKNGQVEKYPYSFGDLHQDNPDVSFPQNISDNLLAEFNVFPVENPEIDGVPEFSKSVEKTPELVNGKWVRVYEVTPMSAEEKLKNILDARAKAYPPITDYIDGVVKGNQAQIDKYIADCLAVKANHPKP